MERCVLDHVGSNIPVTRTPDSHFMTESRYNGTKVVVVSPDYADNTKFADTWMAAHPGTDGALAMAMGHVVLKEFYVDKQVPRFIEYSKAYSDLPNLISLKESANPASTCQTDSSLPSTWATRQSRRTSRLSSLMRRPVSSPFRMAHSAFATPNRGRQMEP